MLPTVASYIRRPQPLNATRVRMMLYAVGALQVTLHLVSDNYHNHNIALFCSQVVRWDWKAHQ